MHPNTTHIVKDFILQIVAYGSNLSALGEIVFSEQVSLSSII